MKKCSDCKQRKPLESFCKNASRRDGINTRCRECSQAWMKRYRTNVREKVIESKKDGCLICGETDHVCLDYHHLEQDSKEDEVSKLMTKGVWGRIEKEIAKCVLICANCHRKLHSGRFSLLPKRN